MSNIIFNISLGNWHFQIFRCRPWVRIGVNEWIRDNDPRPWWRVIVH